MKYLITILYLTIPILFFAQSVIPEFDCPSSPNCVSTKAQKKRKKMDTLKYYLSDEAARTKLKILVEGMPRVELLKEEGDLLHYEFTTKLGKFADDVEFFIDQDNKEIHFRSASRVGWSDMGANKRRMKKVLKTWKAMNK